MYVHQSDTSFDQIEHDIDLSASAGEVLSTYLMESDLSLSTNPWATYAHIGLMDAPDLRA